MRQHKKPQMLFLVLWTYGCLLSYSFSPSNLHRALRMKWVCVDRCVYSPPGLYLNDDEEKDVQMLLMADV